MAFKIKNFYGSPLYSSSPDRPFTAGDTERKEKKLDKTIQQLSEPMSDKKKARKEKKLLKTADQLKRNASGDKSTPFLNIRSCKDIQDEINKKQAKIKEMRDLTKKDKKVRNWDDLSDQVDGLREELKNCKK
jgi:hypothetical protein